MPATRPSADEDEPAIEIGDCLCGGLHAFLLCEECDIPQHPLRNVHHAPIE